MKLLKILVPILLCSASLSANSFLGECVDAELEVAYNSYSQDDWIMGLDDGSCWKLSPLKEKSKQSWPEWWNQVEPKNWQLPDEFFFDPLSWKENCGILVYQANDTPFSACKHILINRQTGQKVFAEFISCGSHFVPKIEHARQIVESAQSTSSDVVKTYPFQDGHTLVLKDKSFWKLFFMKKNQASWSEWWKGTEVDQPDAMFISKLSEWKQGDAIDVHCAEIDDTYLHQKYNVAKPAVYKTYLLENTTRGKLVYAHSIDLRDFLDALKKYAEEIGYSSGYSVGYSGGHSNGYSSGYSDGYRDGSSSSRHGSGSSSGHGSGSSSGHGSGSSGGNSNGHSDGYGSGHGGGTVDEPINDEFGGGEPSDESGGGGIPEGDF